ncbi:MAG: hypothetical protein V4487_02980 [Chlamydiota bacterium]
MSASISALEQKSPSLQVNISKKRKATELTRSDWKTHSFFQTTHLPLEIAQTIVPYLTKEGLGKSLLINHTWNTLAKDEASDRLKKEGYPESLIKLVNSVRMLCAEIRVLSLWPFADTLRLDAHAFIDAARGINSAMCFFAYLENNKRDTVISMAVKEKNTGANDFGPIITKTYYNTIYE